MRQSLAEPQTGTVAALNSDGEGVVREGKTAFVAGALPGESICFQRLTQHKGYDEARLLEILDPSPQRVEPKCKHFGICGGCALQHLDHEAQLATKDQELRDALERVGHVVHKRRHEAADCIAASCGVRIAPIGPG